MRRICGASPFPLIAPFDVLRSAELNMRLRSAAGVNAGSHSDVWLTVPQTGLVVVASDCVVIV